MADGVGQDDVMRRHIQRRSRREHRLETADHAGAIAAGAMQDQHRLA